MTILWWLLLASLCYLASVGIFAAVSFAVDGLIVVGRRWRMRHDGLGYPPDGGPPRYLIIGPTKEERP